MTKMNCELLLVSFDLNFIVCYGCEEMLIITNVVELGAWFGISGYIKKCLSLLHDDLGPNPKKLWLINQNRYKFLFINVIKNNYILQHPPPPRQKKEGCRFTNFSDSFEDSIRKIL